MSTNFNNPDNHSRSCKHMRKIPVSIPWDSDKRAHLKDFHLRPDFKKDKRLARLKTAINGSNVSYRYSHTRREYMYVPCGHCVECKRKKANEWNARLQYEWNTFKNDPANLHPERWFITLTFKPEMLPVHIDGTRDSEQQAYKYVQDFMKRLRTNNRYFGKLNFRYFVVGEFGENNNRFHFHCLLFLSDASLLPDFVSRPIYNDYYDSFMNGDTGRKELDIHCYMAKSGGRKEKRYTTGTESTVSFLLKHFFWYKGGEDYYNALSRFGGDAEKAKDSLSLGNVQAMQVRGDTINGYVTKYLTKTSDFTPSEFESFHRQSAGLGEAYFVERYFEPLADSLDIPRTWKELNPDCSFDGLLEPRLRLTLMTDLFYKIPKSIGIDAKETYKVTTPRWWYRKYSNDAVRVMEFNAILPEYNYGIEIDNSQLHDLDEYVFYNPLDGLTPSTEF